MEELGLAMLILVCRFVPLVAEYMMFCVLAGLVALVFILSKKVFGK